VIEYAGFYFIVRELRPEKTGHSLEFVVEFTENNKKPPLGGLGHLEALPTK
jgi:hypothetical protein